MARGVANHPETHQRMEDWSRGGDGISSERILWPTCKCKFLVGSVMANVCGSHYPLHMAMVDVSSQRILVDKAFSVPKCVRLARMSHHSHRLLRNAQRYDLSEIWGEEFLSLGEENKSDFEKQNAIGKPMGNVPAPEEDDVVHEKMMELVMLALTRLRDFMTDRGLMEVSMPVYDPNRGKLYAILHVVFAETEIMVHLHKKYYLSIA